MTASHNHTNCWEALDVHLTHRGALRPALSAVTLAVPTGAFTAIIGPNGAGKSTLLSALLGVAEPARGDVRLHDRPVRSWTRRDMARLVGVVPQREEFAFPITVRGLVEMGRYPHLGTWQRLTTHDHAVVDAAIARCGVRELAHRPLGSLSGGERQRARLARALAQLAPPDPEHGSMADQRASFAYPVALALDEPTAALDLAHEMTFFALVRELADSGATVLMVTHHLDLAARYADLVVLMHDGHVIASGPPRSVFTAPVLSRVYDWPVDIVAYPRPGRSAGAPQLLVLDGLAPAATIASPTL